MKVLSIALLAPVAVILMQAASIFANVGGALAA